MNRDYRDILAGLLLAVIGLFAALYAADQYEIGTLSEMGSGMFPTACGWILVGLGGLIAVPAFFRAGVLPQPEWREFFAVIGGMLLFALTIDRLGVVVALALLIGTSILARPKNRLVESVVLYAAITTFAVLLFQVGLGLPLRLFKWEW